MIKYDVTGNEDGKLIVFITGAGVGAWMYKHQQEFFTDYKTVFFDLPGHGVNDNLEFTTINDAADMIKEIVVKEAKDKKAIIIGHSIGAQIIMHMIDNYSDYIEKAVIISGLNKKIKGVNWMIKPMISSSMPLIKYRWFAKAQAKELVLPDNMFEDYYQGSLKISKVTLQNIMSENMNFEFTNVSGVNVDALILVGAREKKIMLKSALATKLAIPNSRAYVVGNAAHGIPYEHPALLNNMIEAFIGNKELPNDGVISL